MTTIVQKSPTFLRGHQVLGRLGLALSFIPWLAFGLMVLIRPRWGSPLGLLAAGLIFIGTPLGFLASLAGMFLDTKRAYAIAGLCISGAMGLFILFMWIVAR